MGMRRGDYLALAVEVSGGAFTDPLTEASLAWLERANFVNVRHLRVPAVLAAVARAARNGAV
ncbi:MAG: hypothetical protein IJW99_07260 [Clostridia bacterium]|nr:hypothetical protein [Clostridia bacterium]